MVTHKKKTHLPYEQMNPGIQVERRAYPWKVKYHSSIENDLYITYETDNVVVLDTMC